MHNSCLAIWVTNVDCNTKSEHKTDKNINNHGKDNEWGEKTKQAK